MRSTNTYGVKEWRVWPNKEIVERLGPGKTIEDFDLGEVPEEFLGGDSSAVVDAEAIEQDNDAFGDSEAPITVLVRELTQQFAEQLSREKEVISQLQRDLADKDRQLKLLPDLEKQAEERRKEAELKELEAIALQKQLDAIAEEKSKALQHKEAEMQMQLQKLEDERLKADALENTITELQQSKANLEASLQGEIESLKIEKDAQAKAVQDQLSVLTEKLAKLEKKSWWQKWFTAGGGD